MTKTDMKLVNEWKDGTYASDALTQTEIEFDVLNGLDSMPRVIYLRSLGYHFDNWAGYVQAEINELLKVA
jgi:hypothetical protein